MRFDSGPTGGAESYEPPKPGKYIGVLIGFSYIGTQSGGQYGPKPKVILRWELHKRKGPSYDSKNFIHTITSRFGATIRGQNSLLRAALEAHGITFPEGQPADSHDWLGKGAWLDIVPNGKYVNVDTISKLDPEEDVIPVQVLECEHWDLDDAEAGKAPPKWSAWAIAKSDDISHYAGGNKPENEPENKPEKRFATSAPTVSHRTRTNSIGIDESDIPF